VDKSKIGVIGGSGLYEIDGIKVIEELDIDTPWGKPSDKIVIADIEGKRAAFLPRHGKGHVHLPGEVNYRANIAALKMAGVEEVVAFSACGSLKEEIKPLDFILPTQVIDRTKSRESSFYGSGIAGHVSFGHPFCERLHDIFKPAISEEGIDLHIGETLVCMEGPAFSTVAESKLYRSWGAGIINMTTLPEAKLAREAEICYSLICMSTDYDCWKEDEEHVSVEMVIDRLITNSNHAKNVLKKIIVSLGEKRDCGCREASKFAIITSEEKRCKEQAKKLKAILPDYF
jgi:5'-methylthioadenosine phosphorylase